LHLRLLLVRAKQHQSADRAVPIPLAEVKAGPRRQAKLLVKLEPTLLSQPLAQFVIVARRELLQANPQMKANLLLRTSPLLALLGNRLATAMLLIRQMARPAPAQQEMRHQLEQDSAVLRAHARRYSRCPGPCAFSRATLAARKCNRAARCGGYPTPAQYRLPRNRRVLAGCGNKYSRSQRKRARRVRTFLIAAADKCRCLPRRIAD
jgi:hypothetical protein